MKDSLCIYTLLQNNLQKRTTSLQRTPKCVSIIQNQIYSMQKGGGGGGGEGGGDNSHLLHDSMYTLDYLFLLLTWQKLTLPYLAKTPLSLLSSWKPLESRSTKSVSEWRSSHICIPLSAKSTLKLRKPTT